MTPIKLSDERLKSECHRLNRELRKVRAELRKRERESRPKVVKGKGRTAEERAVAEAWDGLLNLETWSFCWACGRTAANKPDWWGDAPWGIVRAHITHSGLGRRIEHRKLAAALCSGCHIFSDHGSRNPNWTLPRLTQGMLLHLKAVHEPREYDRDFIQKYNIRQLEKPCPLPVAYIESQRYFRGESA